MATGVSIRFREDVGDKAAAERVLRGHAPRSYITWRAGESDSAFWLSHVSATIPGISHVPLRRLPSGAFVATRSVGDDADQQYLTLADFIASRRYLDAAPAVATVAAAADGAADSLHRRAIASAALAPLGGHADVPADLPLPSGVPKPVGGDDPDLVVPPSCSHATQRLLFAACVVLAGALVAWTRHEYAKHERA
jgi:hypothetical protein